MAGLIYLLKNKTTGKGYVGQTSKRLVERLAAHRCVSKTRKSYLYQAINKYGWEDFEISVLEEGVDLSEIDNRETYWISQQSTKYPSGYNLTDGGHTTRGWVPTQETKDKIRDKAIGRKQPPRSSETRLKMSKLMTGRTFTDETKKKMSKNHSDVTGSKNPMYGTSRKGQNLGTHRTKEAKQKIAEANAKWYSVQQPSGETIRFKNLSEFCRSHELTRTSMKMLKRGLISQHKGFTDLRSV